MANEVKLHDFYLVIAGRKKFFERNTSKDIMKAVMALKLLCDAGIVRTINRVTFKNGETQDYDSFQDIPSDRGVRLEDVERIIVRV